MSKLTLVGVEVDKLHFSFVLGEETRVVRGKRLEVFLLPPLLRLAPSFGMITKMGLLGRPPVI